LKLKTSPLNPPILGDFEFYSPPELGQGSFMAAPNLGTLNFTLPRIGAVGKSKFLIVNLLIDKKDRMKTVYLDK
jgi:hypothetical protein